jgi:hypothetical protein
MAGLRGAADDRRDLDVCHSPHCPNNPAHHPCDRWSRRAVRRRMRYVEQYEAQYSYKLGKLRPRLPDVVITSRVCEGQRVGKWDDRLGDE